MKHIPGLLNSIPNITQVLLTTLFTSILWSCGEKKQDTTDKGIAGKYVNHTFLEAIPDSIPGLVPAFCYELNFISNDSVKILFGFEEATLAYRKKGKDYLLIKAMQEKDMIFHLNEDQSLSLVDTAWTNLKTNSEFKKVISSSQKKWDFEDYLNKQMIAGEYMVYKNDKPTGQKVTFNADGTVSGMGDYNSYSLCYSGDCVGEVYPISNNLTLTNAGKESITYAFVKNKSSDKITVHNIEAPIKDMKGERAIKELVYDLRK